ncbi:hypothetical protein HHI36_004928 [Cryptolaemus montrouzieri]|uniref:SPRY domain-containing SOCS box protein 3 n=1 Tax=Cryptolaemus montrouzieri TaxID=559131 RepID=A0ABD2NT82_9CUCU
MDAEQYIPPLRYGCNDIWTWNKKERSPEVRLYGINNQTALFHPNWSSGTAGVRGSRILNNGRYFWELHLSKRIFGTSMMFGIGTKKARIHADSFTNLLGEDANSWGLSHKGLLWHDGTRTHYTKPFRENVHTVIGLYFDGVAGTLTYYKDKKCLGVAFRGLHEIKEPLYPIICSTAAKTEMVLHSMRRDFINLQDRCRAAIIKLVKSKKDLDKLYVPPRIRCYLAEDMLETSIPTELSIKSMSVEDYKSIIRELSEEI